LFGILDAASLLILVPQKDQLMLLACPEATHTLLVDLDQAKRQKALIQHNNLVLVGILGELMPEREQRLNAVENSRAPNGIALIAYHGLARELDKVVMQGLLVADVVLEVVLMES